MADTTDPDGVQNPAQEQSNDGLSDQQELVSDNSDAGRLSIQSSEAVVANKRVKMDGDGDGAPSYTESSPKCQIGAGHKGEGDGSGESTPQRDGKQSVNSTQRHNTTGPGDLSHIDMKTSWSGSTSEGSAKAGLLADPAKIAKEREKEERVRQARQRLMEERRKKLEELKEQQRIAQENREKQLAMRRKKIEDLRRRDVERRQAVEDRRKMKEEIERVRRESILQKAEERLARYEAWKAGGRKGMFGQEGSTPKHLSVSTSVLYTKRNSEFSSMSALSSASRPESTLVLNTIPEGRRSKSFLGTSASGHSRSSLGTPGSQPSPVRMRDKSGPRKPRPYSQGSSVPSFMGGESMSPRSKSTDRAARDRSKTRSRRESKDKENLDNKTPKLSPRDGDTVSSKTQGRKEKKSRSLSFFERLSTPKFQKSSQEPDDNEASPRKDTPTVRLSPRKAYSTTNLSMIKKRSSLKEKPTFTKDSPASVPKIAAHRTSTPKDASPRSTVVKDHDQTPKSSVSKPAPKPTPAKELSSPRSQASARSSSPAGAKSGGSTPRVTPPPSTNATPTHSATPSSTPQTEQDGGSTATQRSNQDITAEEYKARLAEKRRQAREKAEKEAEEERKRLEEERLIQEEKERQEEEEQRRQDEEMMRVAAEARLAEEERLQKAIEAEEKRKREEYERLELEKKQKEEADKKAKEEAEKLEKEKQEKKKREEEERIQRKKKLEMIMKRVKPSDSNGSDSKQNGSSQNSPEETSKPITEAPSEEAKVEEQSRESSVSPIAMSKSTDNLGECDNVASSSPVPRSASTDDILEETKAEQTADNRMTSSMISTPTRAAEESDSKPKFKSPLLQSLVENKSGDSNASPKFKSPLLNSLLGKTKVNARMALSASMDNLSPKSGRSSPSSESEKEMSSKEGKDEDKDEDTTAHHNGGLPASMMTDSALGQSLAVSMTQSATVTNGHKENKDGLVDSSISLHSPQGLSNSEAPANGQFEEIIDLIDTTGANKSNGLVSGPPIIAFDQNRRNDATESLS